MATSTTRTNKPINPRGNDQSPKGYNRAALYSGKALDFDGVNDILTASSNLDISNGSDLSYVGYFKTTETTGGYLFENNAFYVAIRRDDFNDGGTRIGKISSFISSSWLDTDLVVNDGNWHQCAMTLSNGTQKIYIDGQEIASATGKSYNTSGQAAPQIGARDTGFYFDGQIANTRVFNVGLTAAQVADLYNNPEKIVPTGVADSALKLWLPMMEGAGTTCYDGSGGGNHGTISGATWTHGIGAPVAQTAVIDWNKGENRLRYSEDLSNAVWTKDGAMCTANYGTAPDGSQTSTRVQYAAASDNLSQLYTLSDGVVSIWVKGTSGQTIKFGSASSEALFTLNGDWQRIEKYNSGALNFLTINTYSGATARDIEVWGAQMESGSTAGPYVRTGATAQTSDVLLPQGLTSGRDITGVNLFENVRKQGALNLDGNSWAEVHDNASLDITDEVTLEAWVYWDTDGVQNKGILGKWGSSAGYLLYKSLSTRVNFFINGNSSLYISLTNGWNHIVGTYDGANRKIYINGALEQTDADTSTITESSLNVEIGTYGGFGSSAYDQPIAQPRIYNRALTAEEVERNYNAGKNIYK